MKLINKLLEILGFNNTNLSLNNFIIGNTNYIIFEFNEKDILLQNKILDIICTELIEFYWFRTYDEFENNIEYLDDNINRNLFIFIG